jgi:hypothetical protein
MKEKRTLRTEPTRPRDIFRHTTLHACSGSQSIATFKSINPITPPLLFLL